MDIQGIFDLLAKVIVLARRDSLSRDPYKRKSAQEFLSVFLEGIEEVSN